MVLFEKVMLQQASEKFTKHPMGQLSCFFKTKFGRRFKINEKGNVKLIKIVNLH
jgi:hypothetical protein